MARITPGTELSVADIAALIDHALLAPTLTPVEVARGVDDVRGDPPGSVCVRPIDVAAVSRQLRDSTVRVGTVIGFPHGATTTAAKVAESQRALADGARELDMVLSIGGLRGGDLDAVTEDIAAVVGVAHAADALVKVILETAYLDDSDKVDGCRVAVEAGADYVKTSTGFAVVGGAAHPGAGVSGATVADVLLMAANVPDRMGVKASGGIRDLETLLVMVGAGATRIGCSATRTILSAARELTQSARIVVPEPPRPGGRPA